MDKPIKMPGRFLCLHIKLEIGWLPALCNAPECPLPTFIVVNEGYTGGYSLEEWIEQFRKLTGAVSELKFFPIDGQ